MYHDNHGETCDKNIVPFRELIYITINDFEDYYERKHFDAPYCPTTMTKYKYHTERCYETQNIKPVVCQKFFELRILSEVSVCNY